MIIGWFGALFTGRLPVFAADFLAGYLRWMTRVYAYTFLLTDLYPPFTLDDADYPVRVAVRPGRAEPTGGPVPDLPADPLLDRPGDRLEGAFTIVQFVSWLIVLISGRMPDALYQALAAALRYQIRTLGFALMLTSAYPGGLFGDPDVPASWSPVAPPGPGSLATVLSLGTAFSRATAPSRNTAPSRTAPGIRGPQAPSRNTGTRRRPPG